ncbi:MAG: EVE domain-containing protein [Acidobacteria bacterium]|nr:MAG: EVE domain-containing protein [Acidobacteriota bacterium]
MSYWLVKQEPESYSFSDFQKEGKTDWTGVRNYTARNNLKEMKVGDKVFYYHSGDERAVVGYASVTKESFPDPTAAEGPWVAVELEAGKPLKNPVTLAAIKANPKLAEMKLVKLSRLSVTPVAKSEWDEIVAMSK